MLADGLWHKSTLEGAENETSTLLAAMVRHQKPKRVLETGCAHGDTAEAIGEALHDNGRGILYTCDTDPAMCEKTRERCSGLPVQVFQQEGISLIGPDDTSAWSEVELSCHRWDFAFIDSWWTPVRVAEVRKLRDWMNPGGLVCLHDVCQNYQGVYYAMQETGWPNIVLHTTYGLAVFQAPGMEWHIGTGKSAEITT